VDFSRNWLAQYVDLPSIEELSRGLTEVGLAEEGLTERGDDVILDLDVTTNRPDCMNYLGLARETAVRFGSELRLPKVELDEIGEASSEAIAVELEDGAGCPRYVGRVVRDVTVAPSPAWLQERLESVGLRPINNVVDVTNFVLWETGQPIHAFDLDKIADCRIIVRRAREGEKLVTLDSEERELSPEVLVIADAERAVALGGIMGGLDSEVTESTTDVLIEAAHFDPTVVRRGAGLLDMHTDASHRFERGADPDGPARAAARVASLLAEVAGGKVAPGAVDTASEHLPGVLSGNLDHERVQAFGGVEISAAEIERILSGLGFNLAPVEGGWRVTVPGWRYHDMRFVRPDGDVYEADLFEEVLRHIGFDNIPSALPPVDSPDEGTGAEHLVRRWVRGYVAATGLAEAINYAFHAGDEDGRFGIWNEGDPIRITNPLSELFDTMRRSLMSGLVASAEFNQRRGAESVALFEIGRLFPSAGLPEVETVGMVLGGTRGTVWQRPTPFDLFDLKGRVEGLAALFGIEVEAQAAELRGVVSGTGATLHFVGREAVAGWFGQLALPDATYPLFGGEVETTPLSQGDRFSRVVTPSRFPGVTVDLTLTHAEDRPWREIETAISEAETPDLVDFGLKDRYSGEGVPSGAVNTTIFFVYNAEQSSLTQEEVNLRQQALTESLEERFGW